MRYEIHPLRILLSLADALRCQVILRPSLRWLLASPSWPFLAGGIALLVLLSLRSEWFNPVPVQAFLFAVGMIVLALILTVFRWRWPTPFFRHGEQLELSMGGWLAVRAWGTLKAEADFKTVEVPFASCPGLLYLAETAAAVEVSVITLQMYPGSWSEQRELRMTFEAAFVDYGEATMGIQVLPAVRLVGKEASVTAVIVGLPPFVRDTGPPLPKEEEPEDGAAGGGTVRTTEVGEQALDIHPGGENARQAGSG